MHSLLSRLVDADHRGAGDSLPPSLERRLELKRNTLTMGAAMALAAPFQNAAVHGQSLGTRTDPFAATSAGDKQPARPGAAVNPFRPTGAAASAASAGSEFDAEPSRRDVAAACAERSRTARSAAGPVGGRPRARKRTWGKRSSLAWRMWARATRRKAWPSRFISARNWPTSASPKAAARRGGRRTPSFWWCRPTPWRRGTTSTPALAPPTKRPNSIPNSVPAPSRRRPF